MPTKTKKPELRIHSEYLHLGNNPELAELFARPDLSELLLRILFNIATDYSALRDLLRTGKGDDKAMGAIKFHAEIINQLKNSFTIVEIKSEDNREIRAKSVKRAYDGKIFAVGDGVHYANFGKPGEFPYEGTISQLYVEKFPPDSLDRMHVGIAPEPGSVTWRNLNQLK